MPTGPHECSPSPTGPLQRPTPGEPGRQPLQPIPHPPRPQPSSPSPSTTRTLIPLRRAYTDPSYIASTDTVGR